MPYGGKEFCMLYVSAVFMFLFLPILLAVYSVVPTKMRRLVLLGGGISFYVFANFHTPAAILFLGAVCVCTYFAGRYLEKTHNRAVLLVIILLDIVVLFVLRVIYEASEGFVFPLGAAILLLSSISYCSDVRRGETRSESIFDLLLYMTFFPVMAVGPIIKYKDFRRYISDTEHTIENFAEGIRVFSVGFVKLVAIASVTLDAYKTISELGGDRLGIVGTLLAMILVVMTVFFSLSGWSDMGCGLALMFGIKIPRDFDFSLIAVTPSRFFESMLKSLRSWCEEYAVSPLERRFFREDKKFFIAVSKGVVAALTVIWIRTTAVSAIAAIIAAVVVFAEEYFGFSSVVENKKLFRSLGCLVAFLISVFVSCAITSDGIAAFAESLGRLSLTGSFNIYYVYNALSGFKYLFVILAGIILGVLSHNREQIMSRIPKKGVVVYDAASTAILMIAFIFSLLYFMPQYPQYASRIFEFFAF